MYLTMKQAILLCLCEFQGSNPALRSDYADCILYNLPQSASIIGALTHWHTQTSLRRPGSLGPLTLKLLMSHIYIYIYICSAYS